MKIVFIGFCLFINIFTSVTAFAESEIFVVKDQMLSYFQFKQLSSEQKQFYIKSLQQIFTDISHKDSSSQFVLNESLLNLLLPKTYAASSEPYCMYGGFIISGNKCIPRRKGSYFNLRGIKIDLSCGKGQAMCNPMLFGFSGNLIGNQKALCVSSRGAVTSNCRKKSTNSVGDIVKLAEINANQWDNFKQSFDYMCGNSQSGAYGSSWHKKNNVSLLQNAKTRAKTLRRASDVHKTCDIARSRFQSVNIALKEMVRTPTPVVSQPPPKKDKVRIPPPKVKLVESKQVSPYANKNLCKGECKITYKYPNKMDGLKATSLKTSVKAGNFLGSSKPQCNIQSNSEGTGVNLKYGNIENSWLDGKEWKNLKSNLEEDQWQANLDTSNLSCTGDACSGEVSFNQGSYTAKLKIPGKRGFKCELEIQQDIESVAEKAQSSAMGKQNKCLGEKSKNNSVESQYAYFAQLFASNKCDIRQIKIRKKGDWNKVILNCDVHISDSVGGSRKQEAVVQTSDGKDHVFSLSANLNEVGEGTEMILKLFNELKSQKICFNSPTDRLSYKESRRGWDALDQMNPESVR